MSSKTFPQRTSQSSLERQYAAPKQRYTSSTWRGFRGSTWQLSKVRQTKWAVQCPQPCWYQRQHDRQRQHLLTSERVEKNGDTTGEPSVRGLAGMNGNRAITGHSSFIQHEGQDGEPAAFWLGEADAAFMEQSEIATLLGILGETGRHTIPFDDLPDLGLSIWAETVCSSDCWTTNLFPQILFLRIHNCFHKSQSVAVIWRNDLVCEKVADVRIEKTTTWVLRNPPGIWKKIFWFCSTKL